MNETILQTLIDEFSLKPTHAENLYRLLEEGNTVPFISRYRKEQTGSADDQLVRQFSERKDYLQNLWKRKEEILRSIEEQGKLTDELKEQILSAATMTEAEDLYRPYKPKRKTRASVAREKGLSPLAEAILAQEDQNGLPELLNQYIDPEKGVETAQDALNGAKDIIAEDISDSAEIRKLMREYFLKLGVLSTEGKEGIEASPYSMYQQFSENVSKLKGYNILAINRAEREGFLKVTLSGNEDITKGYIYRRVLKGEGPLTDAVLEAADDAYDRLLFPSIEREIRNALTESANEQSIATFKLNLHQLLMQPPVKGKTVLALDPAYRTGCKTAVIDPTGKVLATAVVYPTPPQNKVEEAKKILKNLILKHHVEVLSIGNGTASKETEIFAAELIKEMNCGLSYMMVSEAGASVYSASKLAAAEFPEYDVSLRSAVSIGRRLQDPLAELVKIDPKAIGVGQYQHDMPQNQLSASLDGVVEDCVNSVGVDLNTASPSLLSHIAGLSSTVAGNIVEYRENNGAFSSRKELLKVPKLGKKTFEQCAGFLRIPESKNYLDRTAVHPESYDAAEKLLSLCGYSLKTDTDFSELESKVKAYGAGKAAEEIGVGRETLSDMMKELTKPGRDPRDSLPAPLLRTDVMDLNDLKPGMKMKGTVRNIVDFGAFIDIGVHQDGLVHISKITNRFIRHPSEMLKVGDIVDVTVLDVDPKKKRISLTMRNEKS